MLKKLLLFIVLLMSGCLSAQTFYWVGGSGYWNDASHWSFFSGGVSANTIPSSNSNVIFDNGSSTSSFTIHALHSVKFKSISSQNTQFNIDVIGSPSVDLTVSGNIDLNEYFYFKLNGKINLNPQSKAKYQFAHNKFTNDIFLNSESEVELGTLVTSKSVSVYGSFNLKNSIILTNDLLITNSQLGLTNNLIQVQNNVVVNNSQFSNPNNEKTSIICKKSTLLPSVKNAFADINNVKIVQLAPQACAVTLTSFSYPTCAGLCNGTAVFNLAGCTNSPFTIQWLNPTCATLPPAEGAYSGATYSVNTLCGCSQQYTILFENQLGEQVALQLGQIEPPATLLTFSSTQPTCNSLCNGQIRTNVVFGLTPIKINWNPSATTHTNVTTKDTLKNACAGIYTLTTTNANGCVDIFNTTLNQPAVLLPNGSTNSITCNASCNGSADVTPSGGTPPYVYSWISSSSTPSTSATSTIGNLCPGVVTMTVTDSKTCTAIYSANILQPPAITLTVNKTDLICGSLCDGTASVTASGGIGAFTYSWSPSGGSGASAVGLCSGNYTCTVTNNVNCVKTITVDILSPPTLTASPTQTNIACNGVCSGAININASGGTGTKTYSWSPAAPSNSVITNLCNGVYSFTVTDASLCTYTNSVTITEPPATTLTIAKTDVGCFGACDGTATGLMLGGTGPYTYTWSPGTPSGQGTATITSLCPGTYSLTSKDANNCSKTQTITITQPTAIIPAITTTSLSCNAVCNGAINSVPSGGTGPYTFTLQSSGAPVTTSPPYTNLCAGSYTLIIKDALGCSKTQTINLAQPNPITLALNSTTINCFNQCNATVSSVINGGSPTYTYIWSVGGTGPSLSNQCAGVISATVTDVNGCRATATTTIISLPELTVSIVPTNPNCNAQCTGIATTSVSGGTPNYTINWNDGFVGNINSGLCAGNYTATVTDFNGCLKTQTVAIIAPPAITLTATNGTVSCAGTSCDGTVSVTPTGGTAGYFYSWNSTPVQTNSVAVGLCVRNYVVSVTDANGCIASIAANVSQPSVLTASVSNVQPSCNVCIGAATANGIGGTGPYTYSWSPGGQTTPTASNLCVGIQTVIVTDSRGCSSTQTVQINQTVIILATTSGSSLTCNGICNGIATANPSGGAGGYTYTWTPGPIQNTQTATGLCAGTYTVMVSDVNGCANTSTVNFANPSSITLTVNKTDVTCNGLLNGTATVTATGGTGTLSYLWQPGNYTTASVSGLGPADYTVTVTDINNCSQNQIVTITETNALSASFTFTNPTTCTSADGVINAIINDGTPPYTFTWTPNASINPNVGLAAGTYSLNITDFKGCKQTIVTTLSSPTGPTVTVSSNSVTCFGACTGSATLNIVGTPPINVNWPAPVSSTNTVVTNLCAGLFVPQITDGNGCITNQTVNIAQPTQLTASGISANVTCNSACTGSINLTTSGGTPNYTYSWSPAGVTVEDPTGLCIGDYTVNISDVNNCTITNTFVITQPVTLTLNFNKKDVLCNANCTGGVRAIVSGGTSPYSYTWTPGGSFVGANIDTIVNICSGIYTVTVRDVNGCVVSGTVNIDEPTVLTTTITSINVKCNSQCNGSAIINASGGTSPYTYNYNTTPITPTQTITNLCVGTYTGNVTDANGCSSSANFNITEPLPIVVTTTISNPLCNAVCNGSVATNVTGGNANYSYNWIATGGPVPNPTGLCAGSYTVVVTDDSLCVGRALVVLTDPAALIANITFTNPICNAGCDGIIAANPIGGTTPFSYSWLTPAVNTNSVVSNLCAGDYTLTLTDANMCQDVQTVTLTNPAAITINPAVAPATCGFSDGSINAAASNGIAPYTYSWLDPILASQATNTMVTGIPAGTYTVIVTGFNGCSTTSVIPLSNSNGPSGVTITSTMVTCNNLCDGAATVSNPFGGTAPYTLSWLNSVPASTLISNLCAGTYTAKITDANNCLFFQSVAIIQPQSIDDNEIITSAACLGNCNGAIALNPTGGNGGYSYSWSPAAITGTITNLCPSIYTATITDVLGCTRIANYNVPSITTITSSTFATSNTCFGICNGSLLATNVAGGLPPYSFNWSDPLTQSTSLASGLCSGSYSVTITDANGCFNVIPANITSPTAITFTPNITQPSCNLCNGSTIVNPTGGTAPYSYLWSNNQVVNTATNLCSGVYVVNVTDGNGCLNSTSIVINNSGGITGETIISTDVACSGVCDGSANVTAVGGTAPITYNWVHDNSSSQSISNLCAGTYFCNMIDATGCSRTASVVIGAVTTLSVSSQVSQSSCTLPTGSITVNVTGGTGGPYTYTWLPSGSSPTVTNLAPGNYTLTVSDGNCSQTHLYSINSFSAPVITSTENDISCGSLCDGNISITISGGATTYTPQWSTGATGTNSINGLCAGNYSVIVTDAAGCSAVKNYTLTTVPTIAFSSPDLNNPKCHNDCNGSLTVISVGGTMPYTYSWTPTNVNTATVNGLCFGNYSITVTDANGCLASNSYSLTNPSILTLTTAVTDASCNTTLDGAISTTVTGGASPYSYSWMPGSVITPNLINVLSGTYTLTLTDNFGCVIDSALLINSTITVNAIAGNDTVFCQNGTFLLNGSNSNGGLVYEWYQLPLVAPISNTLITSTFPAAGTTTYVLVATNGACVDKDTIAVASNALPVVDAGPMVSMPVYSSATIGGSPTGVTGIGFSWSPALGLDNPTGTNPTSGTTVTTVYTVTVLDANGCSNSDTVTVFVYPEIVIPNGFSPNSDGKNDVWQIDFIYQFPDCEVEVYNRWGEQLFYSKGYAVPFNGQYKGKDLPVGTYYYIINLNHPAYPNAYTSPLTIFR